MRERDCVIVGAGLAGLTCAFELAERGWHPLVLEGRAVVGGRTSSWDEHVMPVESELHRVLGFYVPYRQCYNGPASPLMPLSTGKINFSFA